MCFYRVCILGVEMELSRINGRKYILKENFMYVGREVRFICEREKVSVVAKGREDYMG